MHIPSKSKSNLQVDSMDEIDLQILMQLFNNSRITFRELGEKLDLSVSAVHKRVNSLVDTGIIRAFVARPSLHALKYIYLFIEGHSSAKSLETICDEIGKHKNVNAVGYAAGSWLYVICHLRDITELQELSVYVTKTGQMENPRIGIVNFQYQVTPEPLTTMDYKIINSLRRDARKAVVDISDETGLSAKTVKKRIDRMVKHQLIRLTLEWNPIYENCLVTVFTLHLGHGMDIRELFQQVYTKYAKNIVVAFSYSNIPDIITMEVVTASTYESQLIQQELQKDGYNQVVPRIWIYGKYYETWIDELVKSK